MAPFTPEQLEEAKRLNASFSSSGGKNAARGSRGSSRTNTPVSASRSAPRMSARSGNSARPAMMGPYTVGFTTPSSPFKPASPSRGRGRTSNMGATRLTSPVRSSLHQRPANSFTPSGPAATYRGFFSATTHGNSMQSPSVSSTTSRFETSTMQNGSAPTGFVAGGQAVNAPARQPLQSNMNANDFTKRVLPAHLQQLSSKATIEQIASVTDIPYENLTSDGKSIPANIPSSRQGSIASSGTHATHVSTGLESANLAASRHNPQASGSMVSGFQPSHSEAARGPLQSSGAVYGSAMDIDVLEDSALVPDPIINSKLTGSTNHASFEEDRAMAYSLFGAAFPPKAKLSTPSVLQGAHAPSHMDAVGVGARVQTGQDVGIASTMKPPQALPISQSPAAAAAAVAAASFAPGFQNTQTSVASVAPSAFNQSTRTATGIASSVIQNAPMGENAGYNEYGGRFQSANSYAPNAQPPNIRPTNVTAPVKKVLKLSDSIWARK